MSLIQRQDALVATLEPIYFARISSGRPGMCCQSSGQRSKAKRLHAEELMAAGYNRDEAWKSANDCDQVAHVNADHAVFMAQMGATV